MKKNKIQFFIIFLLAISGILPFSWAFIQRISSGDKIYFAFIPLIGVVVTVVTGIVVYKSRKTIIGSVNKIDPQYAVQTLGIVTSVWQTNVGQRRAVKLLISMDIIMPDYSTRSVERYELVPYAGGGQYAEGRYLLVTYDSRDPSQVVFGGNLTQNDIASILNGYVNKGNPYASKPEDIKAAQTRGIPASAIVKGVEMTNEMIKNDPVALVTIKLQSEIEGFSSEMSKKIVLTNAVKNQLVVGQIIVVVLLKGKPDFFMLRTAMSI